MAKKDRYPWKALLFIMGNAIGQSFTYVGFVAVLEIYFSRFLFVCYENATRLASTSVNVVFALTLICGLSGGFLADRILGNLLTQVLGNVFGTLSLIVLLVSTWQFTLNEPTCCTDRHGNSTNNSFKLTAPKDSCNELHNHIILSEWNLHIPPMVTMAIAVIAIIIYSIMYGHVNSIQSVFVGDQFSDSPEQAKSKERSFSWFYLWSNVGNIAGEAGLPIMRQSLGFTFTILTVSGVSMWSTAWLWLGVCLYTKKKPVRPKCFYCKRNVRKDGRETDPLIKDESHPKATEIKETEKNIPNITFLGKLKRCIKLMLPLCGVFLPLTLYWSIMYQQNSTWVVQALEMNCFLGSLKVPPDLMPSLNDTMVVFIIPLLDYVIVPHLEASMKVKIRSIHKLVAGMVAAALSFLLAGLLQLYISKPLEDCMGQVNIAWQVPQYLLVSLAEVLISVTGLEFAYTQAPPNYRNLVTALWLFCAALGTLINAAVAEIPIPAKYMFFAYACAMTVVVVIFILVNRRYQYRNATNLPQSREFNNTDKNVNATNGST